MASSAPRAGRPGRPRPRLRARAASGAARRAAEPGKAQLVGDQQHGLGQVEGMLGRVRGYVYSDVAQRQLVVAQPLASGPKPRPGGRRPRRPPPRPPARGVQASGCGRPDVPATKYSPPPPRAGTRGDGRRRGRPRRRRRAPGPRGRPSPGLADPADRPQPHVLQGSTGRGHVRGRAGADEHDVRPGRAAWPVV